MPHHENENGAQIDFIIDRSDNAVTVCEIKCTDKPFDIDKSYAANLNRNMELLRKKRV